MSAMKPISRRRDSSQRIFWLTLDLLGIFVPPLMAFPVASRSCIPLAVMSVCISLTSLILFPFFWRRTIHPEIQPVLWSEDSPELKKWIALQKIVGWLAPLVICASLLLWRPWHRGQINWQQTISACGYMLMAWSDMIRTYIDKRRPSKPIVQAETRLILEGVHPIQSEHWGQPGATPLHN